VFEKNKFRVAAQKNRLRMQLGQKDRFIQGIFFSGRYIREMEKIFKDEGVPMELTRLPFVESSFNLYAYSHVGASGIWQFMRSTGKLFKLKIDPIKDLRNDPLAATRAAAQMLRFNYKLLGSWPLALTGYNHGPGGVSKIVKDLKTNDINEIVWNATRRRFGFASENFSAEFLAALEVESHADKYFGKVPVSPALEYDEVQLPRAMKFGELALAISPDKNDSLEKARLYNPFFTRAVLSGHRKIESGYTVRVPKNSKDKFLIAVQTVDPTKAKSLEIKSGVYKILPGDTISSISKDFGIAIKELLLANGLTSRTLLHPGQSLIIPTLENQ
jgi:membrane-bound lytic murein transglycosylase D